MAPTKTPPKPDLETPRGDDGRFTGKEDKTSGSAKASGPAGKGKTAPEKAKDPKSADQMSPRRSQA